MKEESALKRAVSEGRLETGRWRPFIRVNQNNWKNSIIPVSSSSSSSFSSSVKGLELKQEKEALASFDVFKYGIQESGRRHPIFIENMKSDLILEWKMGQRKEDTVDCYLSEVIEFYFNFVVQTVNA